MNEMMDKPREIAKQLFRKYYTQPGYDVLIYNADFILLKILNTYKISTDPFLFRIDSFCGMLVIDDNETTIVYNEAHIPSRRNFTIAHELGHYFLHSKDKRDFVDRAKDMLDYEDNLLETQANTFAAELILPDDVLSLMLSYRYNFYRISKITGASVSCLRWRLVNYLKERVTLTQKDLMLLVTDYENSSKRKTQKNSHIFTILSKSTPWNKVYEIIEVLRENYSDHTSTYSRGFYNAFN